MFSKKICKVTISKTINEDLNVLTEGIVVGVIAGVTRYAQPIFASETTNDGKCESHFFCADQRQFKIIEKLLKEQFSTDDEKIICLEIVR